MKTLLAAFALVGCCLATAAAQEFVTSREKPVEVPLAHEPVEQRPTVAGIVAEIFNVKKPWQLVNPLAPKSYGDGRKTVSYSEKEPGKPKGFIVASVEW